MSWRPEYEFEPVTKAFCRDCGAELKWVAYQDHEGYSEIFVDACENCIEERDG